MRTGGAGNTPNKALAVDQNGVPNYNYDTYAYEFSVRPALHLNLKAAENGAVKLIDEPADIELGYNTKMQTVQTANPAWYDSTLYASDIDITYKAKDQENNSANDTTKAGVYDVTLKITSDDKAWTDAKSADDKTRTIKMTINPAPITVTFPLNSGKENEFGQDTHYPYTSTAHVTYKMGFPDDKIPSAGNFDIISLVDNSIATDTNDIKIEYLIVPHKETLEEHTKTVNEVQQKIENEYYKTASGFVGQDSPTLTISANTYMGYCIVYRITAPNHEMKIGYMSVHIVQETLKITVDGTIDPLEYGGDFQNQEELHKLAKDIIESVTDNNGEWRYSKSGNDDKGEPIQNPLDTSKFHFHLKKDDTDYFTSEDGGTAKKWDAGDYTLEISYIDNTKEQELIACKWMSGSAPKVKIEPKKVNIDWTGNEKYDAVNGWDENYKKGASSESDLPEDGFCWIFDDSTHTLKGSYKDVDNQDIEVTVDVANNKKDVGTYTATATVSDKNYQIDPSGDTGTQQFKIIKAKNDWTVKFACAGWSIGEEDKDGTRTNAVPKFKPDVGDVVYEYHKNDAAGNTCTWDELTELSELDKDLTVYVTYSIVGNDNFDALTGGPVTFTISKCSHKVTGGATIQYIPCGAEDTAHKDMHYFNCPICHVDVYQKHTQESALGHNSSQHYKICSVCKANYEYAAHQYLINVSEEDSTCAKEGTKVTQCACGEQHTDTIPKKNHTVVTDDAIDATCTSKGKTEGSHCSVCETIIVPQTDTDMLPHTEVIDAAVAATCTKTGLTQGKHCSVCNTVIEEQLEVPMTQHTIETDPAVDATCTSTGLTAGSHCSVCKAIIKAQEEVAMLEHVVNYTTSIEATCTSAGLEVGECAICHEQQKRTVEALGHALQHVDGKEPTATSAGNLEYWKCSRCSKMYSDSQGSVATDEAAVFLSALGTGGNQSLGGDTGLSGNGSGGSDFLEKNLWWIILLAAILIALIAIGIILSAVRAHKKEKRAEERDRQFETFMKMSMMRSYGVGDFAPASEEGAAALDGQAAPAQLPFNQEMFDAAVAAAVKSALTAIGNGEMPNPVNSGAPENVDVDGFYDDVEDPDNPTGNGDGGFDGGNGAGSGGNG